MPDDLATQTEKLVSNEQAKLTATLFNNVAVAFVVAGVVVPLVALAFGTAGPGTRSWFGLSVVWMSVAFVIHWIAPII